MESTGTFNYHKLNSELNCQGCERVKKATAEKRTVLEKVCSLEGSDHFADEKQF